jgi:hypothetical protein
LCKADMLKASPDVRFWADTVAKVESCNGLNFWRELEARRDR